MVKKLNKWKMLSIRITDREIEKIIDSISKKERKKFIEEGIMLRKIFEIDFFDQNFYNIYNLKKKIEDLKTFEKYNNNSKHLVVLGESGLGKTEFILHKLDSLNPNHIYINLNTTIPISNLLKENTKYIEFKTHPQQLLLVFDNFYGYPSTPIKLKEDLRHTFEHTSASLSLAINDKGIEFISYLSPKIPTHLIGDPGRLRQILLKLYQKTIFQHFLDLLPYQFHTKLFY